MVTNSGNSETPNASSVFESKARKSQSMAQTKKSNAIKFQSRPQINESKAQFYDGFRVSYPDLFIQHIYNLLTNLTKPRMGGRQLYDIVELGAGTGIFTRAILKHLPQGYTYLATEPSMTFLQFLKQKSPEVETRPWSAANIRLPDESVKNVVCADCFNLFSDEAAMTEMHRVLVPGGKLMVVWNAFKTNAAWVQKMEEVLSRYYIDSSMASTYVWKNEIENFGHFSFVEHFVVPGLSLNGPMDVIVNRFLTNSTLAAMEADEKTKARRKFEAVIEKFFSEEERQNNISLPFVCELYCTQKTC